MSAEAVELRAGPVRLQLDGSDLRGFELGRGVVVQRLYPAFRDAEWRTAPIVVDDRQVERSAGAFVVTLEGTARLGELDLRWTARAEGEEDGAVTYALDAEARGWFESSRLGLCVHLDAAACAGGRAVAKGEAGEMERRLGDLITPQPVNGAEYMPMMGPFTTLAVSLADRSTLTLRTGGTPFELEDQRNWADSSLKAYSSGPAEALRCAPGDRVHQELRLDFTPAPRAPRRARAEAIRVGAPSSRGVPPVGVGLAVGSSPVSGLSPGHVRLDVGLGDAPLAGGEELADLVACAGSPVELAVHGSATDPARIPLDLDRLPLARVLALERGEQSTSAELRQTVRRAVGRDCPIGVGTSAHFSEVCRRPPRIEGAELLCWSAHPQVHAGDDRSVIENLPGLGAQVRTARALLPDLDPVVSVLRLAPAGSADPRGATAFGAAWAVGAFAQLFAAGVNSVTVGGEAGEEAVVAVAAALMEVRSAPLRHVEGLAPGVTALAWGESEVCVLLANLRPAKRTVMVELPTATRISAAPLAANGHASEPQQHLSPENGRVELPLGPYESLRLTSRC